MIKIKALIVAAGKGERINAGGEAKPKPLYELNGEYLIGHVIQNLKRAGITDICVVVGFMKEKIKAALGDGSRYGVRLNYIDNEEYSTKANGWSVYVAKEAMQEPFILSMADHIFEPELVSGFVSSVRDSRKNYLCTDSRIDGIHDIEDATKVFESDGQIKKIHKKLPEFNSIDCGMFHLTPEFFDALEKSQEKGDYSITGGVQELASQSKMFSFSAKNKTWMDIDTREELGIASKVFPRKAP